MDKLRCLLLAIPSLALGGLLTASLTTPARAQGAVTSVAKRRPAADTSADAVLPRRVSYVYKVVFSEADLNAFAAKGYEYVGQSSGAAMSTTGSMSFTTYTMRKAR